MDSARYIFENATVSGGVGAKGIRPIVFEHDYRGRQTVAGYADMLVRYSSQNGVRSMTSNFDAISAYKLAHVGDQQQESERERERV